VLPSEMDRSERLGVERVLGGSREEFCAAPLRAGNTDDNAVYRGVCAVARR
jgi:hypothetical protein